MSKGKKIVSVVAFLALVVIIAVAITAVAIDYSDRAAKVEDQPKESKPEPEVDVVVSRAIEDGQDGFIITNNGDEPIYNCFVTLQTDEDVPRGFSQKAFMVQPGAYFYLPYAGFSQIGGDGLLTNQTKIDNAKVQACSEDVSDDGETNYDVQWTGKL